MQESCQIKNDNVYKKLNNTNEYKFIHIQQSTFIDSSFIQFPYTKFISFTCYT